MRLRNRLLTSFLIIKKNLQDKNVSRWLFDNFYLIDKHYNLIIKDKNALAQWDFYELLWEYCEGCDFVPEKSTLTKFLRSKKQDFSFFELSALKSLLASCAIIKLSDVLKNDESKALIPNLVKLLFSLNEPDFDDILPNVWKIERLFIENEEGYNSFDKATKHDYRSKLAEYAKTKGIDEEKAFQKLFEKARYENIPLGAILFKPKTKSKILWFSLWSFWFLGLFAFSFALIGWMAFLLLVPFGLAAASVSDSLTAFFVSAYRAPRIELSSVPDSAKTLVAVTALMTDSNGDSSVFDSLSRFCYMNPDKNIYFCLLADFKDSKNQTTNSDKKLFEFAKSRIDELNRLHGERFCLFFRKRVKNKSEDSFGGWERKRGAVCELVSHIMHGNKGEYYYGHDFIKDIRYLLTLDSDTNLSVGSVLEMLSVALHPANRPITKNGKVISGYGIIQPTVLTELSSAYKSGFSRLISGSGGADAYANASFRRSMAIFGSGSFCGKGLIDVRKFDSLVGKRLPEGLVLSHDVIEGSILRTLSASDIILTDSTPSNTVSFFRRLHRWIRGDFQNLFFLKSDLISPFSKTRILGTVLRHSSPIFSLLTVIIGSFVAKSSGIMIFLLAYSEFFLPCVFSFLHFIFSGSPFASVRFFSKATTLVSQTFLRLFFEISSSARKALLSMNAFCLSTVRLFTRKKTLEWTTAAQTEKLSSSLGKYVLDSALSAVIGLFLLIFAVAPFLKLCGLFYFVYPLVSAVLSRTLDGGGISRPSLSEKQKKLLTAHASDMFSFYYDNVNEKTNHLPPDNIQLSPVHSIAMRTSPTNIGFYLVSLLAACDIGRISPSELFERLDKSIGIIEKLEKYRGNLYNWYDLKNLSVIGEHYISSVDSGNFIVMLVALKEGVVDFQNEEPRLLGIASRCEKLVSETELTPLYDSRRGLFKIGLREGEEEKTQNCYDLLMSEARMTGYFAVASSIVPKKHWQSLSRTLTHKHGYIGMKSWSGTAFEYLMPQLFLPLYRDSFIFESVAFSLMAQRNENQIWGVSESGFYSFDSEMNYQYKANGLQTLALRRIAVDEKIISPYSTYLSLCIYGNLALKNLKALENLGMYGKYGLYEALDKNENTDGIIVKSYMAHHVGMSIIACLNAVKDNVFVRRFMSDKKMSAASELLQEKIPIDAHVFDETDTKMPDLKIKNAFRTSHTESVDISNPKVALLTRGDMTALVSSSGHIGLSCGERILAYTAFEKTSMRFSPAVIFSREGERFGCAPLLGEKGVFGFEQGNGNASHIVSGKDFSGRVRYSFSKSSNCFVINTRAEALKKYDITLVFEPVLETKKKYLSHISFSRLFIEAEYDREKRILFFHRRSGEDGHHVFTLAVAPKEKNMDISFLSSKESISASLITSPLDYTDIPTDNTTLECIDPLCLVRVHNADGGKASFLISCGVTKQECEKNIKNARNEKADFVNEEQPLMLSRILPELLYKNTGYSVSEFSKCSIGDLWSRSISGDHPICLVSLSKPSIARIRAVFEAFLKLSRASLRVELVFVIDDEDEYSRPIESSVRDICASVGAMQYIGRNGGIFFIRRKSIGTELFSVLKQTAKFFLDLDNDFSEDGNDNIEKYSVVARPLNAFRLSVPVRAKKSHCGYFIENGFVVDKSALPLAPYSYILTGYRFSTVVTQSSLGYSFFDNARERRIASFYGDMRTLDDGERIFALVGKTKYDLCACSNKVVFEKGKATYFGEIEGNEYSVTVVVSPRLPIKMIRVESKNLITASFELRPVMGDNAEPRGGIEQKKSKLGESEALIFRNPFGMTWPEGFGFGGAVGGNADETHCALTNSGNDMIFFVGASMSESGAEKVIEKINLSLFEDEILKADEFALSLVPKIKVKTKSDLTDAMMNFFLPYQVSACRFYARGSFYQSGGAYGFRDQLQDSLSIVFSNPLAVRTHLIRCCAHQYTDGSVMHWWHTRLFNGMNRGIKSKCSDDMLYLPLVVADYIEKTEDYDLLDVKTHYLSSPPLSENERYEQPEKSDFKESVYHHCLRALSYADKRGKNGLLLMGSCDWNDAFSLVGAKGIGESVFTTLLYIITVKAFLPIIEKKGDFETLSHYKTTIETLKNTVEEKAFYGDRYARAICDDGTILGIEGCGECEIDILSQAFASMAELDEKRVQLALNTAFSKLYDRKHRIFKLFDPPFTNGKAKVGYIRGYASGIRENGGQYTHGVLWGALGCIKAGMNEEALLILDCANPASRSNDAELAKCFKTEPYAVCADIYSASRSGRGGWSWYTGAASWFYKIMLENVLGIKLGKDKILSARPIIEYEMVLKISDSVLKISASHSVLSPKLNGKPTEFPLMLENGENILELPIY